MAEIAPQLDDVERRRKQQARRLSLFEIPALRSTGLFFLSIGIYLNNRYFFSDLTLTVWLQATTVLAVYCAVSWISLVVAWRRFDRDLTLFFLIADMFVWTYAIYVSGVEQSRLFFILFLRVADQTQTTFRRCLGFVALSTVCYAAMVAWSAFVAQNPVDADAAASKLIFIAVSGLYIAMSARTAEARRHQMRAAMHMGRNLIAQLEERSSDLREARARAEEANAAKSEFLANMSHEMRTPLHGVMGMLQLARDGEMSAERARHIDLAHHSAASLLSTIDDVLEFAKIEARKLQLEPVYFSIRDLMHETMKPLGVTAASKGLVISYIVDAGVPDSLWTDPLRLRQVITNLAGNAIKFTPTGEIAVSLRAEKTGENSLVLHGVVEDTGIGIDPSVRRLIFEPFTQVDSSKTRRYSGTGLGLAIVAHLVEAMGGSVDVTSDDRGGSRFAFSIAAETDGFSTPEMPHWEKGFRGKRVGVIDHHAHERSVIVQMLEAHGITVDDCAWLDQVPQQKYDCYVVIERQSRHSPAVVIRSPIEHDSGPLSLTRPVDERELIDSVAMALGLIATPAPVLVWQAPLRTGNPLRVLVVEDHPIGQEFAMEALRRLGHSAALATDGAMAVSMVKHEDFDVILMDVQMPGMDGLEATRQIRGLDRGGRIPIIAMTAHTRPEERDRCFDAGMNAILTKPLDRRELADALGEVAPREESLVGLAGGNAKLLARVTAAYVEQTPLLIAAIHEAIDKGDGDALYKQAHKLKGSVSHFPTAATNLAEDIETSGKNGDFEKARSIMPQLEEALRELGERLTAAVR